MTTALRIESEPRADRGGEIFRSLLREVVATSEAGDIARNITTNPDGVRQALDALETCRSLVARGSEDDCRVTLVYLIERQEKLIQAGVYSCRSAACEALVERIREEMVEDGPAGDGELLEILMPIWKEIAAACQPKRCVIAGSVRRGKTPKDIDIVCMPRRALDLFGAPREDYPELEVTLERMLVSGQIRRNEDLKANGTRLKRFIVPALDDMPLELYITGVDNFGAILAIRTGNSEFNHAYVTRRCVGGLMPNYLRMVDGELTRFDWKAEKVLETLSVPTEAAFFARLDLPVLPPTERNSVGVARLRDIVDRGNWARREAVR
jgi:hypothetical protein